MTAAGRIVSGTFYKIFVIDFPAKGPAGALGSRGSWRLAIGGKKGAAYEAAAIVDTERVRLDGSFMTNTVVSGESLAFELQPIVDDKAFAGNLKVTATLQSPAVAIGNLVADRKKIEAVRSLEPRMSPAEQASLALTLDPRTAKLLQPVTQKVTLKRTAQGTYRASLRAPLPGTYAVVATVNGEAGEIGHFARRITVMTVVGPGPADSKASRISAVDNGSSKNQRYVTLVVAPRNAGNAHLGPGYASAISVELSQGRTIGGAEDLGDGRYMLVLAVAAKADPDVKLAMGGINLYAGPLSKIAANTAR